MKLLIFVLINALGLGVSISENETKVVLVQAMFRHGIRSVLLKYPNDTKGSIWDKYGGLGQLTPVGMRQLYNFGTFFRNKYQSFLNPTYDRTRVFARSTDYDRTLQSCYSFLSSVYKPNSDQRWAPVTDLNWLPIPVHTANLSDDRILHANAECPRYDELRNTSRSTPEYLALQSSNQNFLDNMTRLSGLTNLNQYMIWQIADKAMVEEAHNLTLDQYIIDNYDRIMEMNDYTFYIDFVTDEMGRLISGGLLNDIVNNIKKKVSGSKNELYIYTVHDNYVSGMQKILNTSTNFVQPNFASGFVFELRNDTSGNYYIQVLYKNNKPWEPDHLTPVKVNGCEFLCPLNQFYQKQQQVHYL
ncbi:unnamed protein product [Brachionus calyciflorus]|uniref:acid phosphatase n=1 Tax=Brachionus calyciflorus TaxID=104777 RepID=A0A813QQG9_9BILA|nr:unnamed protein product [Brachionus calyciflorus]